MPLLSWPAADLLVCWLCHWTVADSALAYATRAMTLHPVAAHCATPLRGNRGLSARLGSGARPHSHQEEVLFPAMGSTTTPQTRQAADKALRQTCARLGLEGVSTHSFRRSLATAAVRRGVSLHVIQRVTRHKSLGSLGHYLEADESEVLAAIVG